MQIESYIKPLFFITVKVQMQLKYQQQIKPMQVLKEEKLSNLIA